MLTTGLTEPDCAVGIIYAEHYISHENFHRKISSVVVFVRHIGQLQPRFEIWPENRVLEHQWSSLHDPVRHHTE
jgi:hypothetical protein